MAMAKNVLQFTTSFPNSGDLVLWVDIIEFDIEFGNDLESMLKVVKADMRNGRKARIVQILED